MFIYFLFIIDLFISEEGIVKCEKLEHKHLVQDCKQ